MKKNLSEKKFSLRFMLAGAFLMLFAMQTLAQPAVAVADGFARGTTGGGNATPTRVTTAAQLAVQPNQIQIGLCMSQRI